MTPVEKWSIWTTSAVATITGVLLAVIDYLIVPTDPFAVVNHPAQPWVLRLHILSVPFLVFAIGSVAIRHVWKHYRGGVRRARRTGIYTALMVGPMILTGYLIQVVTNVTLLAAMAVVHLVTSMVFAVGLTAHQVVLNRRNGGA